MTNVDILWIVLVLTCYSFALISWGPKKPKYMDEDFRKFVEDNKPVRKAGAPEGESGLVGKSDSEWVKGAKEMGLIQKLERRQTSVNKEEFDLLSDRVDALINLERDKWEKNLPDITSMSTEDIEIRWQAYRKHILKIP